VGFVTVRISIDALVRRARAIDKFSPSRARHFTVRRDRETLPRLAVMLPAARELSAAKRAGR
jgi:hypothetical protein